MPALPGVGIHLAFGNSADFSRLSPVALKVSNVAHEAFIAVDEKGTKAATATVVVTVNISAIEHLDRPVPSTRTTRSSTSSRTEARS